ncbi:MAG: Outer rane lipoprotein SmpA [Gammaproteobacteria bacterium]|nr:Outer rane lipoprotein SmpA [Gammaproteobacteria bacterium]
MMYYSYLVSRYKYSVLIFALLLASGCAENVDGTWKAPFVYRVDVQQGNVVDQAMINKLKQGMDKNQVRFIMGTPLLIDPFHTDRWEYIYSFEPGGGEREQRHIILYFKDEKLTYVKGDIEVTLAPVNPEEDLRDKTVVVPLEEHKEGFFSRMMDKVTPGDDEKTDKALSEPTEETVKETAEVPSEPAGEVTEEKPGVTGKEPPALTEEKETALLHETPEPESENKVAEPSDPQATTEEKPEDATAEDTQAKQEKSLLRRFWDKMTTDDEEAKSEKEKESESEQDAEVFKEAGGGY